MYKRQHWILAFYEFVCKEIQAFPGSTWVMGRPELWKVIVYYIFLLLSVYILAQYRDKRKAGFCMAALCFVLGSFRPAFEFLYIQMDVGQGDCACLFQNEKTYLIDGGSTCLLYTSHNFPFYLHFKGGKGIAVSAAVIVVSNLHPVFIGVVLAVFILVVVVTRYVSLGSLIVVWYIPIFTLLYYRESDLFPVILIVSLLFTILAYIKHKANIIRLIHGRCV